VLCCTVASIHPIVGSKWSDEGAFANDEAINLGCKDAEHGEEKVEVICGFMGDNNSPVAKVDAQTDARRRNMRISQGVHN
jgi:hypothetical protein